MKGNSGGSTSKVSGGGGQRCKNWEKQFYLLDDDPTKKIIQTLVISTKNSSSLLVWVVKFAIPLEITRIYHKLPFRDYFFKMPCWKWPEVFHISPKRVNLNVSCQVLVHGLEAFFIAQNRGFRYQSPSCRNGDLFRIIAPRPGVFCTWLSGDDGETSWFLHGSRISEKPPKSHRCWVIFLLEGVGLWVYELISAWHLMIMP